jgi:predicted nucleic acid-binding protein
MANVPERLWDSSVVLAYLGGFLKAKTVCDLILQQGERDELLLHVSTMAQSEVAFLPGYSDAESEDKVKEFFSRKYIKTILFDILVARESRRLIRKYRSSENYSQSILCSNCNRMIYKGLKPPDAVHLASALLWNIPILETYDPHLLKLNGKEGTPPIIIREPLYEGTLPFPDSIQQANP